MATAKKDIEILIDAITLDAAAFSGSSKRMTDFKIVYPRLAIAQKTTSKILEVKDGAVLKPAWDRWTDRILFKESVQGTFGLEFSITAPVSEKDLENAASSTASTLIKLFGDAASDALGIKALNAFAELPATGLAKVLSSGSYSAATAAVGATDIPGEAYGALKAGEEAALSLPVVANRNITKEVRRASKSSAATVTRKTVVRKGDQVGTVTLRIKAL